MADYIEPSEAARILGVSSQTVRNLMRRGELDGLQTSLGRVIPLEAAQRLALERAAAGVRPGRNLPRREPAEAARK